ncbi:MAG: ABC transporter ATP-binding protein [Armatimonadetes bacterium]|nr:ABC transporter ATP-binding protein [Armatimonadota bacterium]
MQSLRKLVRFVRPYRFWAVLAPLFMVLEVAMDLMQPHLVQNIIDVGIARTDMGAVVRSIIWMVGAALVGLLGGMGCTFYTVLTAQGFGADLRRDLFRKVQALSFGNLDRLETGALITRLTNDVTQVQEVVMILLRVMVRAPLLLVGSLVMAVITCPQLAFLYLFLIPVVLAVLLWVIRKTYPMFHEAQRRLDALNTVMQENLAGVRVVKAFARSRFETERFSRANDRLMEQNITTVRFSAVTMPFVMLALNLGVVAAIQLGGAKVHTGTLQVGQVIAFINYLIQTLISLMMVSMLILRLSRGEASASRIGEVLESEPEVKNPENGLTDFRPEGRVAFENVRFSFSGGEHDPVLKEITFTAEPGQTVAVLGATGSGKSSLAHLIPRFYDVTAGRVTIDGIDVRSIDEAALRRAVGIALQESILFSGAIRENIRYGRPDASNEEVVAAAKTAQAHDFISRFPDGYDSAVGQRGVNLSGGQKQRIAIARALLARPAVLILDDSASSVDVATEARIQAALAETRSRQTRFLITQRIGAALGADKILVLEDGMIAAAGTHSDLLETSPIYREIYESQKENRVISDVGD